MVFASTDLQAKILSAPDQPGCYIYRDAAAKILYIGKALILKQRVRQYFDSSHDLGARIEKMVEQIRDVEFVITDSEAEALILETNLIKKYRPKYNVLKKDDKNYQWLLFDNREDFAKPLLVREQRLKHNKALYFGPYNESLPLRRILKLLRSIYPYRTCNRKIVEKKNKDGTTEIRSSDAKPCLYYFLGLCQAPCAGFVSKKAYQENLKAIRKFFSNEKSELIKTLRTEMYNLAAAQDFEAAAKARDRMQDLIAISQKIAVQADTDEHKFRSAKLESKVQALGDLLEIIGIETLSLKPGFKMECYDISNTSGKLAVGSMVAFVDGFPAKKLYRKFRIQRKDSPNDFAMLAEVFNRRFSTQEQENIKDKSFSILPDLIIVDGGKGQLSSVYKVLAQKKIDIPVIGLAKRFEEIFAIDQANSGELNFIKKTLPLASEARYLMQRIRDEAHRFGITYHRGLRLKAQKFSILNEIPGVGRVIGGKLLKAFGSIEGIRNATDAELKLVVRNTGTVTKIRATLQPEIKKGP